MMLINLTPHTVTYIEHINTAQECRFTFPSKGIARVDMLEYHVGHITLEERNGMEINIYRNAPTGVVGLPDDQPGVGYIVSRMVAEACPHRYDLFYPDQLIRDAAGVIIGCAALGQI